MEYREHRNTGISEIGVGCYAPAGGYGHVDPAGIRAMLWRAHDLGVTFFDTATSYGKAERMLSEAPAPVRDQVSIATKLALRHEAWGGLSRVSVCLGSW